jgi:taurine dioxygenase
MPTESIIRSNGQNQFKVEAITGGSFGARISFDSQWPLNEIIDALCAQPAELLDAFYSAGGLVVLTGMHEITAQPELMLRISQLFGNEVENYRQTPTPVHMIHPDVEEILILSNLPPCNRQPPPKPQPERAADGSLPVQFPHRRGWHTDQSFRRPPPDVSLFYAVTPCTKGQGQTLFADGVAAYDALSESLKEKIEGLEGLHALLGTGRSEQAVKDGDPVVPLLPHQLSQRQPLVRVHPVTGKKALYLCEGGQMDWLDGPVVGLEPGLDGDGAALIYELMSHCTSPEFTYAHDWDCGDLVVYDNRNLLHSATWYDAQYTRLMWRTTVMGNPGPTYAGEAKSWIPEAGVELMQGLGKGNWGGAGNTPPRD